MGDLPLDIAYKLFKFFGSLKMAVFVLILLAILSAVGTFYESRYNAEIAQILVYKSIWMEIAMVLFSVAIIFSAVDRLPWKRKHIPFFGGTPGVDYY
ncbi:MAG: hypothetical protein AB8E15_08590, partial [Bdellovibrionales bacterium]